MPKSWVGQPAASGPGNTGGTQVTDDQGTTHIGSSITPDAPTSQPGDASVETGTQVNLLGGLISPATVEEAKPRTGSAASSFLLRKLSKLERDVANLKSAQ